MGKSSKRKQEKRVFHAADLAVSVYGATSDMSKEDLIYLKQQLAQQALLQARLRNKSQSMKKSVVDVPPPVQHHQFFIHHQQQQPPSEGTQRKKIKKSRRIIQNHDLIGMVSIDTIDTEQRPFEQNKEEEQMPPAQEEICRFPRDLNELKQVTQGYPRQISSKILLEQQQKQHFYHPSSLTDGMEYQSQPSQYERRSIIQQTQSKIKQSAMSSMRKKKVPYETKEGQLPSLGGTFYGTGKTEDNIQGTPLMNLAKQSIAQNSGGKETPRDIQRTSLLLQRVGLKSSKIEFHQSVLSDVRQITSANFNKGNKGIEINSVLRGNGQAKVNSTPQRLFSQQQRINNSNGHIIEHQSFEAQNILQLNASQSSLSDDEDVSSEETYSKQRIAESVLQLRHNQTQENNNSIDIIQFGSVTQRQLELDTSDIKKQDNYFGFSQIEPTEANQTMFVAGQPPPKIKVKKKPKEQKIVTQNEELIICLAVSIEPYMKRCMTKLGWGIAPNNSQGYHIRFDITDKEGTHNKLRPNQWYNHFPNNRELTTKAGLCKNLWHQCSLDYELQIQTFFPRCYDLSDQKHIDQFIQDFQQTAILSIIRQYSLHFLNTTPKLTEYLEVYFKKENYQNNRIYKQKFRLKCSQIDCETNANGNLLGNDTLRIAMAYIRQNVIKKSKIDANPYQRRFSEDEINMMVEFSQQLWETGIQNQRFSIYEQVKTLALHKKLCRLLPQYDIIDGVANVWVVKPSFNARGLGVYCTNKLREIIQPGKKSASKVVQKYIESPFLISKKKFDIRQWVLVTSWEPLDIYVFSGAYLKMCGNDYNLRNLADSYSHLSNFSIQKGNKQFGTDDLVMSHDQFEAHVKANVNPNFTWESDMRPQLHHVIFSTLKGVQDSMEHRQNTFEIYGFDLILDENLHPWVIEVNLSPACNERTEWITKMVDDMCLDLLTNLEQKILMQIENESEVDKANKKQQFLLPHPLSINLNREQFYIDNNITYKWIRLDESIQDFKQFKITEQIQMALQQQYQHQPIELNGQKLNIRAEKAFEKDYKKFQSTLLIQRYYRGYLARLIFLKLKQQKSSILIQRYLRQKIASNKAIYLIKARASTHIQRYLRTKIAVDRVTNLRALRILTAQSFVALRCQSNYRRKLALREYKVLKLHKSAKCIQSHLRRFIAFNHFQKRKHYVKMILRLQRFFRWLLHKKRSRAIFIQKMLRAVRARKRVYRMLAILKGFKRLTGIAEKKKTILYFEKMKKNSFAIRVQRVMRGWRARRKVEAMRDEKARDGLKGIAFRMLAMAVKNVAELYREQREEGCWLIQRVLRGYKERKLVIQMIEEKEKERASVNVQKYCRAYLAKWEHQQRKLFKRSLLKIQAFARMVLAKREFKILKAKKQKQDGKKWKKFERKFSHKNSSRKPQQAIENYIENLLQKEMGSTRELAQNNRNHHISQTSVSQTPGGQLKGSFQELPQMRQSFILEKQGHSSIIDKSSSGFESSLMNKQSLILKNTQRHEGQDPSASSTKLFTQHPEKPSSDEALVEKLQKSLKVRKHMKRPPNNNKHDPPVSQFMQNYAECKGSNFAKEMNKKVISAIRKSKTSSEEPTLNHSASTKRQKPRVIQDLPKPKSFAENLMNMLAKQNIGQAFSENPVEALAILKEKEAKKLSSSSQPQQWAESQHTIENNGKTFTQFPKLSEFKSATNNIYLQNRPLADPRQDQDFVQFNDRKQSRGDMNKSEISMRKSVELAALPIGNGNPNNTSLHGFSALEENMMLSRPKEANMVVVQAYKRQFQEYNPAIKKKGKKKFIEEQGIMIPLQIKKPPQQNNQQSIEQQQQNSMPPIHMEPSTKLMII